MHQQTLGGGGNNKPSLIDRIVYRKLMVVIMFIFPLYQVQILYFPFFFFCPADLVESILPDIKLLFMHFLQYNV